MTLIGILVGGFLLLAALGVPIAISMAMAAAAAVLIATDLPIVVVGQRMLVILDSFPFLALPFFIVAGLFMEHGGITRRLMAFAGLFVGRITGGLGQVAVGTNLMMSSVSGSATASCAATGSVLIPALSRAGYAKPFACALTAAASTVGPIIPPSIMFVLYGAIANQSIGALFAAGIVPGLCMGLYLMIATYVISKWRKYPKLPRPHRAEVLGTVRETLPSLVMPVVVLGGIYGGIFTPTEAGAIAAVYAFALAVLVHRELAWSEVPRVLAMAGTITAAVMLIVAAASLFGWLLARERVPDLLVQHFSDFTTDPLIFLVSISLVVFFLACFFEAVSLLILVTPVLVPLVLSYGIDPVHFAVVLILNLTIGLLTPPVGMNMFIVCSIGGVTIRDYTIEILPFLGALLAALAMTIYFPSLSLYVPELLGY